MAGRHRQQTRSSLLRWVPWVIGVLALALGSSGCAQLFPFWFGSFELPESVNVRVRYSLLASIDQVANAAQAELNRMAPTDRTDLGAGVTRFSMKDPERGSGEEVLFLRKEGDLLVAEFRMHLRGAGEEKVEKAEAEQKHTDALQRGNRIFKVLRKLPGVGPVVDSDGIPKDRQFLSGRGETTDRKLIDLPNDAGPPAPAPTPLANDAGPSDAAASAPRKPGASAKDAGR